MGVHGGPDGRRGVQRGPDGQPRGGLTEARTAGEGSTSIWTAGGGSTSARFCYIERGVLTMLWVDGPHGTVTNKEFEWQSIERSTTET